MQRHRHRTPHMMSRFTRAPAPKTPRCTTRTTQPSCDATPHQRTSYTAKQRPSTRRAASQHRRPAGRTSHGASNAPAQHSTAQHSTAQHRGPDITGHRNSTVAVRAHQQHCAATALQQQHCAPTARHCAGAGPPRIRRTPPALRPLLAPLPRQSLPRAPTSSLPQQVLLRASMGPLRHRTSLPTTPLRPSLLPSRPRAP